MCLFQLFAFILSIVSFVTDSPHALPVENDIVNKPIPLNDKIMEVEVVAVTTKLTTVFHLVGKKLYVLYFLLDLWFSSL